MVALRLGVGLKNSFEVHGRGWQHNDSGSKSRQGSGQVEGGVEACGKDGSVELEVQPFRLGQGIGDRSATKPPDHLVPASTLS